MNKGTASLIALDWGTTNVRAVLLDESGNPIEDRRGESGVGQLSQTGFESRFDELTCNWPNLPAIAAGMVGSRQGWQEARYLPCPASSDQLSDALTVFEYNSRKVAIVPGLTTCHRSTEHDVMRGEETQIAGLIANEPGFTGTVVLPGTHSKWARVENGTIVDFQTYMTGDLYDALSNHTILRHSMEDSDSWDENAFAVAFGDIFFTNGSDWARLFAIRGSQLIHGGGADSNREKLSGILIGSEFAAAKKDGFDDASITLIGSGHLLNLYQAGAKQLALETRVHEGTSLIWPALWDIAKRAGLLKG